MKTIIFGKESNLTSSIKKKIKQPYQIISSRDYLKKPDKYNLILSKNNFKLIINGFSPSNNFKKINQNQKFIDESINSISLLLDRINKNKIKKLIFSSSSSVNNLLSKDNNYKINTYLQSSSKLLIENLVLNYCKENKISFNICRIANIFGGKDNFSIIYRLLSKSNQKINITNNGNPTRDFIHVEEVANIYIKLLNSSKFDGIINIGTGNFLRVREIIDKYQLKNKINFSTKNINESIFQNYDISIINNFYKFKKNFSINYYLNKKFGKKIFLDYFNPIKHNKINLVCYGTGVAAKQMLHFKNSKYSLDEIDFFIDDNQYLVGRKFMGKPIFSLNQLKLISQNFIIKEVVIAISNISEKYKQYLYDQLINLSNKVITIPIKSKLLSGQLSSFDIEEDEFEYLFDKKTVSIAGKTLNMFSNQTVLVTGGAGSIGSELVNQLIKNKYSKIVVLDNSEYALYLLKKKLESNNYNNCYTILGDINDYHLLKYLFEKYKFNYVFHSAAYKHVNLLEENILSAIKNNILATNLLLEACKNHNRYIKFTFISTDKADNPKSILGYTKRLGEIICQSFSNDKNMNINIVRFGNVFASRGSAVPLFIKQIRENTTVTLTNKKAERYFMSIKQACSLVIKSSVINTSKNKIYVLDMGKPIKILDLIYKLNSIYGDNKKIYIKEIGLNKGEKLIETLSYKKKIFKSKIKDILYIKDKNFKYENVNSLINKLKENISNRNYNHISKIKSLINK